MSTNVIAFGEGLIRLSPPRHELFEQAHTLAWHVGGAEANVAVGLACLGMDVAWVSRLTDNPLGQHIAQTLRGAGVDTRAIVWTTRDRVGLYFAELAPPRALSVTYDRAGSAFAHMQPADLPLSALTVTARTWLHTTGITLALGEGARASATALLAHVQARGGSLSFDVNYRAKLWQPQEAAQAGEPFLQAARVVFVAERDVRTLYGLTGEGEPLLRAFAARYPQAVVVMSRGEQPLLCAAAGEIHAQPVPPLVIFERIGLGDALAAGFLAQHVRGGSLADALRWGVAMSALKAGTAGDLPRVRPADVKAWLEDASHIDNVRR